MRLPAALLSIAVLISLDVSLLQAQPLLDRVISVTSFDQPLIITKVNGQTIGQLSKATDVPMGFEGLPPLEQPLSINATKNTLRAALDAMIAADRRYEWREEDGVIVVRPTDSGNDRWSVLDTHVAGITLRDVSSSDLLGVLTRMVGVAVIPSQGLGDSRRFSVEIPEGTLLGALNAIVRAHGTMTWAIEPSRVGDGAFPISLSLLVGPAGVGFGIPASVLSGLRPHPTCCGRNRISSPAPKSPSTNENSAVVTGRSWAAEGPVFDRIVRARGDGRPIVAHGVGGWTVRELAAAVGVPMGLEYLPHSERQVHRPGFDGLTLTSMTFRDALATLVALDPRYEWRDLGGVIVIRPASAWSDSSSPLFRSVGPVRLDTVTMQNVIGTFSSLLGAPEHVYNSFPDTRTFSVDVPQGSVLDLLTGIARSHGELCWEWDEVSPSDRMLWKGRRFMVLFGVFGGGGLGVAVQ